MSFKLMTLLTQDELHETHCWASKALVEIVTFECIKDLKKAANDYHGQAILLLPDTFNDRPVDQQIFTTNLRHPVFMIFNDCLNDQLQHLSENGMTDFFLRPLNESYLIAKLECFIANQQSKLEGITVEIPQGFTLKQARIYKMIKESGEQGVDREVITNMLWPKMNVHPKTLDVHIFNIRRKLKERGQSIVRRPNKNWVLVDCPNLTKDLSNFN